MNIGNDAKDLNDISFSDEAGDDTFRKMKVNSSCPLFRTDHLKQ